MPEVIYSISCYTSQTEQIHNNALCMVPDRRKKAVGAKAMWICGGVSFPTNGLFKKRCQTTYVAVEHFSSPSYSTATTESF